MAFGAVLFDLDGTLLDTLEDLTDAMNAALAERGHPPRTTEECRVFIGDGVLKYIARALPDEAPDAARVADLLPVYRSKYTENWDAKTRPYPGIVELLAALTSRGISVAVVSNKPDDMTRKAVAHFLPGIPFAAVLGARPGVPIKPDPTSALSVAADLGLEPADVMFVGDMEPDMRMATAAGMCPVGVTWGFRTGAELQSWGARHLVEHPSDILALLNRDEMGGPSPQPSHRGRGC